MSIGFKCAGITEASPKTRSHSYLIKTDYSKNSSYGITVSVEKEIVSLYHTKLVQEIEHFNRVNHIVQSDDQEVMFVAKEKEEFVGGVFGIITEDTMYLAWLVVCEPFRGKRVGMHLMNLIEDYARCKNLYSINLGSVEFQAKSFYERIGYHVMYTKLNDPKGYKSFSMLKKL